MECPRPELLGRFVDDQVDEAARVAIEEHLDDCDECRPVVAMLAKTASQRSERAASTRPVEADADPMAVTAAAPPVSLIWLSTQETWNRGTPKRSLVRCVLPARRKSCGVASLILSASAIRFMARLKARLVIGRSTAWHRVPRGPPYANAGKGVGNNGRSKVEENR